MNHVGPSTKPKAVGAAVLFPQTVDQFTGHWPDFKTWLTGRGAEILACATRYEVVRFTTPEGIGVVTRNANNNIRPNQWSGGSASAWIAYRRHDKGWRVCARTESLDRADRSEFVAALVARDGLTCCYCPTSLKDKPITIEHFVAAAQGGPNHLHNMALACVSCNTAVGHKPVVEKLRFAQRQLDRARQARLRDEPKAAARLWAWLGSRA